MASHGCFTPDVSIRWRFVTPRGDPFSSIGVVHAGDMNLRYPHHIDLFAARYGSSRRRRLREGLPSPSAPEGSPTGQGRSPGRHRHPDAAAR
jgi:hypothetical protein